MAIRLASEQFELLVEPQTGGSISAARWKDEPFLDTREGGAVLDMACFPLVPFSNRIAGSSFAFEGRRIDLARNHPGDPECPVLHGFGWLLPWEVEHSSEREARLSLAYADGAWPWEFAATLDYAVQPGGFSVALTLENLSKERMPAGLGFHPYFPRNEQTLFHSLHLGEWQTTNDCIPTRLEQSERAIDWWSGAPVGTRLVDTVYTGREGVMEVHWPDRGVGARILPSPDLSFTTVYVPDGESYFCVEPVSHMTDAFNRDRPDSGMWVLEPGENWQVSMHIEAFDL